MGSNLKTILKELAHKKSQNIAIFTGLTALLITIGLAIILSNQRNLEPTPAPTTKVEMFKEISPEDGSLQLLNKSISQVKALCKEEEGATKCQYEKQDLKELTYEKPLILKSMKSEKFNGVFLNLKNGKESNSLKIIDNEIIPQQAGTYRVTVIGSSKGVWQFILKVNKSALN